MLRIAQVAPLVESVPPRLYGGTERVVAYLTDELVRRGHQVTLFATGDSITSARLVAAWPEALRFSGSGYDDLAPHLMMLEELASRGNEFDVVHFHLTHVHFPMVPRLNAAHLTTQHGRLDIPELAPLFEMFAGMPLVSISDAQRGPLPRAGWIGTVHHGLPRSLFRFHPEPGRYLAFLGRISPEKRVDRAIAIAIACGQRLRIAAKVDRADRAYFEQEIRPQLDHPLIEFTGEIADSEKEAFLGRASALLFPIDWPEPFGMVMIEALACGVPVVAFRHGSVPEVIDDGVTGFIVDSLDDAIAATQRVPALDRRRCRAAFERRFDVGRMTTDYLRLYEGLVTRRRLASGAA